MKICDKCGAHNSNERHSCVDCDARLGDALSAQEERIARDAIESKMEKLYNAQDPLYVSLFDKVMGWISVCGVAALLVLVVLSLFGIHSVSSESGYYYVLTGLLLFGFACIEAFFPKVTWTLEKWRLSFTLEHIDDATPGYLYKFGRKVSLAMFVTLGAVCICGHITG